MFSSIKLSLKGELPWLYQRKKDSWVSTDFILQTLFLAFSTEFALTSYFFYLKILYTPFIKYVTGEHRQMVLINLIWFLLDLYEQIDG